MHWLWDKLQIFTLRAVHSPVGYQSKGLPLKPVPVLLKTDAFSFLYSGQEPFFSLELNFSFYHLKPQKLK